MVLLVTTGPILSALEAIPTSSRKELELPESLTSDAPISHDQVIRLSRYFRGGSTDSQNDGCRSLDSLLHGTRVYVPPPPPKPEPSPEYIALKARLLAAAEADAYKRMTASTATHPSASAVFSESSPSLAALHDLKANSSDSTIPADPITPSLVLNIFLSIVITGFSVYWALTSFQTPDMLVSGISSVWQGPSSATHRAGPSTAGTSSSVKVLLSFLAALGVGVAEVMIYAIYLQKIEQARSRERKFKERKVVIGSEEVRGRQSEAVVVNNKDGRIAPEGNGEIIWGRGPNGGLRRRVREKWEEDEKRKDHGGESVS